MILTPCVIIQLMKTDLLSSFLDFTVETAYLAGRITLGYFLTGIQAEVKTDDSPVTIADRKSEQFIRDRIQKHYPESAILGEEFGPTDGHSSHRWIIDPIDGTKSFLRGVPLYAVLIGLEIDGLVEVGAAYFPGLDLMISGASGLGCWCNGRRVHISEVRSLDQAVISCTTTKNFADYGRREAWERLLKKCYFQTGWGDAYGYMLVASGRIEVMLDPVMNPWDAAPFLPILREAGGYFGDWQGKETIYGGEGLATSLTLLPELLELIQNTK
jgi:histidinol-phosphatase